jgi:hydrogenase-4 component F
LTLHGLTSQAKHLDPQWLKAAFLMLLVGYGTKMGLVPMHTWLPDAHSEAPSPVSALLSGALLNCAFLAIIRGHTILTAAGLGGFSGELLVAFGILSMGVAAALIIRQRDYKRLLAYSSIEHMGILALGLGLGGLAASGAMLHAVNHSAAKGLLFLVAGNLLATYGTKDVWAVRGVLRVTPLTGVLWLGGFLAITGSPPFGTFFSELTILRGAMQQGRYVLATGYLLALGVIFVAMARVFLPMGFGEPAPAVEGTLPTRPAREPLWSVAPPMALGLVVLALGLWVPQHMWNFLAGVTAAIGGQP